MPDRFKVTKSDVRGEFFRGPDGGGKHAVAAETDGDDHAYDKLLPEKHVQPKQTHAKGSKGDCDVGESFTQIKIIQK